MSVWTWNSEPWLWNGQGWWWGEVTYDPADLTLTQVVQDVLAEWPAPIMAEATHVAVFRREGTDVETPFDPQTEEPIALVPVDQLQYLDEQPASGDHVYQVFARGRGPK
jgi:hypothetical protein